MPLRLDIKRKLTARSDRVKSVDLHPTEPWMLCSLYQGHVNIWNHETQTLVKTFEVCDLPVRTAKFVPRKNWVITGSDDMQIRIFNYNTLERVHSFEAHSDYVRCIAVHPTQPFILTSSDDMWIKLWNWEKSWICQQVFEGHTHYVMQIVFNPKDNNTFASASLDRTVKVWQLGSSTANFTLEGHEKGVNCVDYYHGGDKPYLISGADDRYVKIWDYQNKTCVQTLGGHTQNISAVCFHPELPIFLTASEDGTVRIWHAGMYRLESSLNYGFERVWTIACMRGSNNVAIGYDEGSVMVKVGREEPAVSMDSLGGKIVWARHSEIQQVNLKALGEEAQDGERLPLAVKDMGACEIYPQTIQHNPNGRFLVVCGDGEYIIYTSMALRNKAFGQASEFVWAADSSQYAVREGNTTVKVFKNFKEKKSFKPDFGADGIFGGFLLGVSSGSGLCFFDWDTLKLIRRIDIQPTHVYWAENASLVALATSDQYFILKYHADVVVNATENSEDIENAFEMIAEMNEVVKTGLWVGDCFIYTNSVNRINYFVGGEVVTVSHLDRPMYLLGYVPRDNRLYLCDKELSVVSYSLLLSVLEYQTAVMRKDFETANRVLPTVPKEHRTRVAHFLEKQGFKEQALAVSTDPEHRFELALALGNLATAHTLAKEANSQQKWRQLASLATQKGKLCLAQECLHQAQDFGGLLLLATSTGNSDMIQKLGAVADDTGKNNISFLSNFILGDVDKCLDILIKTDRIPEAAFFARTYAPSKISAIIKLWKEKLSAVSEKAGQSLADPEQYENLFPGYREALKVEKFLREESKKKIPASAFPTVTSNIERKPLEEMLAAEQSGAFQYKDSVNSTSETEEKPTEAMIDRLQDLSISTIKDILNKATTSIVKPEVPEKATTKPTSSSRPLTVDDDDDLDIDLEIDDNIDTTGVNLDDDLLEEED
ncbi:PREDICTED: coatomer subunit beta' [Trachymyrmex septentrionalis]|uniref:coatomer subunit beta' n=1 Tax=Trachymyrmex septentrionalis TaxID=34720 RepID=UPI00084F0A0D|nr:PREDICTED: coatomer subunit beta' [Trachymyrmex septentrionalis]